MTLPRIMDILAACQPLAQSRYHARLKGVFGSTVRATPEEPNDIDILVEFDEQADLLDWVGLAQYLEERLHCQVDLVPIRSLRAELKDRILAETVYL